MPTIEHFKDLALSLPETTEQPHFENISFKVNKKIFATLNEKEMRACLKLTEVDQDVFSTIQKSIIYPVPNKWGKQGWTLVDLEKADSKILEDALITAYCTVAPKKLSEKFQNRDKE
jgi:hypothetical protein